VVFGTCYNFMDGFNSTMIILYFDFISKNYIWIASMCFWLSIISIIGAFFVLSESPLWQLKMGKVEVA